MQRHFEKTWPKHNNMLTRTQSLLVTTTWGEIQNIPTSSKPPDTTLNNARPRHLWRNLGFYDGVLVQQQHFPSVSFANRVRVEVAVYRRPFLLKWQIEYLNPLVGTRFCKITQGLVFFCGKVQGVLVQRKLWTSSARPSGELERPLQKFVVVTWCETNVAIKVCLDSFIRVAYCIVRID